MSVKYIIIAQRLVLPYNYTCSITKRDCLIRPFSKSRLKVSKVKKKYAYTIYKLKSMKHGLLVG